MRLLAAEARARTGEYDRDDEDDVYEEEEDVVELLEVEDPE